MQVVAPAGSYSALRAAINAGADAVYLGLPLFGARAKAQNFDEDSFVSAVEYAHAFGTKVLVTLNTLIKDSETDKALELAAFARDNGADAIIVQDIPFIKRLRRELPDMTLHASTQMGVHNADGARALIDMGLHRAVLARETLPEDIAAIKKTGIEIEFFVQGALCVCFSGNCYFSSLASSYSGNRGKCMQLCRKPYELGGKTGYFLSAKDIFLYDRLKELEALGVDAVKIEGRMRSDEYVYTAVGVYKSDMPAEKARETLKTVYNRGDYCSAYLDGDAPFNVIHSKCQANIGISVGKISKVADKTVTVGGFTPHKDDGFKILRGGVELGGASVRGEKIVADCRCATGDELRRTLDGALAEKVRNASRKLCADIDVFIAENEPPRAHIEADGVSVDVTGGEVAQRALSRCITCGDIERSFAKTAEYPIEPHITAHVSGEPFLLVSAINEFRRKAYSELWSALIGRGTPQRKPLPEYALEYNKLDISGSVLMVEDADVLDGDIISSVDIIAINPRDYANFELPDINKPVLLNLPVTMRGGDREVISRAIKRNGVYGVISNNIYTFKLTDKPILLGPGHNIIGAADIPYVRSYESDVTVGGLTYAFGYAPVMTLCHCPYGKCKNCSGNDVLTDAQGRRFAMRRYKSAHCYWQILNCVPHDLTGVARGDMFYDCTALSSRTAIKDVLRGAYKGERTRGNINKGLK